MVRAVHRLQVVVLTLLLDAAVFVELFIHADWREHAIRVPLKVTRGHEQVALGDVWAVNELIARLNVTLAAVILHDVTHDSALRVEHRETRTDFLREREKV